MFTLTQVNEGIKVLDIMHLMVLAKPFIFDPERLPLDNPDNGSDWKNSHQVGKGKSSGPEGREDNKEDPIRSFGSISLGGDYSPMQPPKTKTKTSEDNPLTKTVAEYFYSSKGDDNRHPGLRTTKITYRESDRTPYFNSAALNAKDHMKP
ncbi:hypothetical protein E3N88_28089 [Mikania micrantha]|uniref:Uncharacterized protein n=1 Tax=Mikania micrantha TaxID=192012 RepID=A0A5N6MYN9_9ASTR|nr:hypothetical protein E3N88_28089 [Mikania micrantha]